MATVAMFTTAARILSFYPPSRVANLRELGSEGAILEVADDGKTLGIREPRERWRIARDGSSERMPRFDVRG